MKLSAISTDKAASVLCELTPYIANITADEELIEELRRSIDNGKANTRAELLVLGAEKVSKLVPIILKKRKADVFGILAVLNEKTPEEIGKQNLLVTMAQLRDIAKDKELVDFFKSCTASEGNG